MNFSQIKPQYYVNSLFYRTWNSNLSLISEYVAFFDKYCMFMARWIEEQNQAILMLYIYIYIYINDLSSKLLLIQHDIVVLAH
jgi:hypothetical protein